MIASGDELQELASATVAALKAAARDYPGGIPIQHDSLSDKEVLYVGPTQPQIVFVRQAVHESFPFSDEEGQLLHRVVEQGLRLSVEHVGILGIVGGQRSSEDIQTQLKLLKPEFLIVLGKLPLRVLPTQLQQAKPHEITKSEGMRVVVTYGLAEVLANQGCKRQLWLDLKQVMSSLGME